MEIAHSYLQLIFLGLVSLFPPINPLGTALIMGPLLDQLNQHERRGASLKIAFYCFLICTISTVAGAYVLELFGISLPVVQLAGGLLICRMGLQLLSSDDGVKGSKGDRESSSPINARGHVEGLLFYPLAFPMTTGAGTISVLLTLSAQSHRKDYTAHLTNLSALFVAISIMCVLIYLSYAYTPALIRRLGPRGGQIVNRLSAFLVFCVGIQIAAEGALSLFKSAS